MFENKWVHGDWVVYDGEQYIITGRSDDTLNIAGKRIGPAEYESILVKHNDVIEAAAIGVPDDVKGEVCHCFVV
ncbi:AMP-binding enzyme [Bacillus pacificus]